MFGFQIYPLIQSLVTTATIDWQEHAVYKIGQVCDGRVLTIVHRSSGAEAYAEPSIEFSFCVNLFRLLTQVSCVVPVDRVIHCCIVLPLVGLCVRVRDQSAIL